jgi:uncharacterized protein YegP (UPF0339 family)
MAARFEIRKRRGGQYYFVVIGGNNRVVATSENFANRAGCQRGIESVKRMAGAPVRDETEASRPAAGRRRTSTAAPAHPGKEPTATPARRRRPAG